LSIDYAAIKKDTGKRSPQMQTLEIDILTLGCHRSAGFFFFENHLLELAFVTHG